MKDWIKKCSECIFKEDMITDYKGNYIGVICKVLPHFTVEVRSKSERPFACPELNKGSDKE